MPETEIIELKGFNRAASLPNLPQTLNNIIRRGSGRILVACNVGMRRSQTMKDALPYDLVANPNTVVGYGELSVLIPDAPQVIMTPDGRELMLKGKDSVQPFTRILLANGNPDEAKLADLIVLKPLLSRYQNRLTQIITVDLIG